MPAEGKDTPADLKLPVANIVEGGVYQYLSTIPRGCQGHSYRVLFFVLHVPSMQKHVCVEALTGPDKGLRFTCSEVNFSIRYKRVE